MRIQGTKGGLLEAHYEINSFQQNYPTISAMIGGRIESFYRQNSQKIHDVQERRKRVFEKYVQKDDEKKVFKYDEQKGTPILIEPVIELAPAEKEKYMQDQMKAFEKELEFLNDHCEWII